MLVLILWPLFGCVCYNYCYYFLLLIYSYCYFGLICILKKSLLTLLLWNACCASKLALFIRTSLKTSVVAGLRLHNTMLSDVPISTPSN